MNDRTKAEQLLVDLVEHCAATEVDEGPVWVAAKRYLTLMRNREDKKRQRLRGRMTKAARKRHLEIGGRCVCPYCGHHLDDVHSRVEYGDIDADESGCLVQEVRCLNCNRRWTDVFTLTDVREIAGPGESHDESA